MKQSASFSWASENIISLGETKINYVRVFIALPFILPGIGPKIMGASQIAPWEEGTRSIYMNII